MFQDPRSDEDLVTAYQACLAGRQAWLDGQLVPSRIPPELENGDLPAGQAVLEILLTRYSTIVLSFIGGKSFFFKDKPYLDDVRQEVLIKVFNGIRDFISTGPGSFKRWVFKIAYFECLNQDKARRKCMKLTSEIFTEETTGIPDDLVFSSAVRPEGVTADYSWQYPDKSGLPDYELTPRTQDYDNAEVTLETILSKLSDDEQKLIQLVAQHTPYRDIIKRPEFSKYKSVDYLMLKVHNLRKKIK